MPLVSTRMRRLGRYALVGVSTFGVDLSLLWILIDVLALQYLVATAVAFLIAVSLNYFVSRAWVFRHTERALGRGYVYFLQFALIGALVTTLLMWLLTSQTELHYALARILIAGVVGVGNYVANLYFNFKVAGRELE